MSELILSCRSLSKQFNSVRVLHNVTLTIEKNQVFGLLGLNGAGKTTLIKCLLALIRPSDGEIIFKGKPISAQDIQRNFSYLPESFQLFRELTAQETVEIMARGLEKRASCPKEVLSSVGLAEAAGKRIKAFSRGMQQRLGLAVCLMKNPEVLVLDDPFLGLDVAGQVAIIKILEGLKKHGTTILFSSHTLSQVEKIVDSVGIIDAGVMRFQGKSKDFIHKHNVTTLEAAFLHEIGYEKDSGNHPA